MPQEVERKFLLKNDGWRREGGEGTRYRQGYIPTSGLTTVRIRIAGDQAFITIKGAGQKAGGRSEYEYGIPLAEAEEMLAELCRKPLIEKRRHKIKRGDLTWEIDEFHGDNEDLVVAEVELESFDQKVDLPDWIGRDVTAQNRYFNSRLAEHPYSQWSDEEKAGKGGC